MKKIFILIFIIISACKKEPVTPGFAIVVDQESYKQTKNEIIAYAKSVEADGLKPVIVIDKWQNPDSIKSKLIELYYDKTNPIEGAVFVGDIPVAMIRNAQHFTRAFKMNQEKYSWDRSSIPSDRFYDDFNLQFTYLKKDSINSLLHYYSLNASSNQYLSPNIYTGRIKPPNTLNKYQDLKNYLIKLVRIKQKENIVDEVLYFSGYGYNSDSFLARIDEKITLLEQFPWLNGQQNRLEYINHADDIHIKHKLMSELQRNNLDIALLHHHGHDDMQYLSGMPKVKSVTGQINGVKQYLRSKLRTAKRKGKDLKKVKNYYSIKLSIPLNWFDGTFDKRIIEEDSIFNAEMDISISDMKNYTPNAKFLMFDSCFNGSFQKDDCIASAYIFDKGNTIVSFANSVSSLQDKWPNEMVGLLGVGIRIGNWAKQVSYLETHIIGDPTYHFTSKNTSYNINEDLFFKADKIDFWKRKVNDEYADVQALALRMLYQNNYEDISDLLFDTFKNSEYGVVRMECLKLLTNINDSNFINCVSLATNDSYELVRRQALYLIGKSGDNKLIKPLLIAAMANNISPREKFNIKQSIGLFEKDSLLVSFDSIFNNSTSYLKSEKTKEEIKRMVINSSERWSRNIEKIFTPESTEKNIIFAIRSLRNYNYHPATEKFCNFILTHKNSKLQKTMIEALGWFNISVNKDMIISTCNTIVNDNSFSKEVKTEAQRTLKRLSFPWSR